MDNFTCTYFVQWCHYIYIAKDIWKKAIDYKWKIWICIYYGDDIVQNNYSNKFINSYCDIFYYYQQNQKLFKVLKDYMVEIVSEHEKLKKELDTLGNNEISPETKTRVGTGYYRIYELLQSIQNDCINYKV